MTNDSGYLKLGVGAIGVGAILILLAAFANWGIGWGFGGVLAIIVGLVSIFGGSRPKR